ncbi:hypothetical protein M406DRAFT_332482 [Cryphonectria parasitica EP155]|uniref:Uncharacterized protein n=1 Tax=Cryphonectria parasitica (strain ATCC 38755 / EP155) TaxID=660469 RepID=A0A9P5CLJ5_CRYP1|nr:uncharacterized protein M406DRAFT_332482 [Cryphonectria parasitica EP155]KAF3762081.1 hypothetical protein M406DRAFT_332482 [Cryphonectria parasitica EP155]
MTSPDPSPDRPPSLGTQSPLPAGLEAAQDTSLEQQQQGPDQMLDEQQPGPPPAPFQPLFTLVTDSITHAAYHPRVHYIFSDDDPQLLTDALADHGYQQHALASPSTNLEPSPSVSGGGSSSSSRPSLNHPPLPPPVSTERAIILDLVPKKTTTNPSHHDDPTSSSAAVDYEVAWASSLSSDWAVVSTKVSPMADDAATAVPEDGAHSSESYEGAQQRLMMLRIEGVDIAGPAFPPQNSSTRARKSSTSMPAAAAAARKSSPEERDLHMSGSGAKQVPSPAGIDMQDHEDYGAILEEFEKRMVVLRKVVDAGMERQHKIAAAAAAAEAEQEVTGHHHDAGGVGTHDWAGEQVQEQQEEDLGPGEAAQPPAQHVASSRAHETGGVAE